MEQVTSTLNTVVDSLKSTPASRWAVYAAAAAGGYMAAEQLLFLFKKGSLPGPGIVAPIVGGIVEMVFDPYKFWERQRLFNPTGLSWNSIAGIFMVYSAKAETTSEILKSNGPDSFKLVLHPNGWKILGEHNIAFKWGEEHRQLRRSFLGLFTRKALGVYLEIQDQLIRESLDEWLKVGDKLTEMRIPIRDMNVWTSQKVFCGPYVRSREERDEFNRNYQCMAEGFLSFPINLPGTGLWRAIKARHQVAGTLERYCRESKARMAAGGEPACLLDFWSQEILREIAEADAKGEAHPKHSSDFEMGNTLMDFLFASQDASTASLTWIFALMNQHPDVLAKVREEQARIRPNDEPICHENVEQMTYTKAVIKEVLRFRPPAVFVPQMAMADVELENYKVPKGTLVIPSLWAACMQGFPDAEKFDPERMMPERAEDSKYRQNFLTFGVGPHMCVGREYAINHLIAFLALLSTHTNFTRKLTSKSDGIAYLPTIYPADCLCTLSPRNPRA